MFCLSHTLTQLLEANNLTDLVTVLDRPCSELTARDFGGRRIDAVIGEPFFSSSLLPWHNLHYWYALTALKKHMSPECAVLPNTASLMAIAGWYLHVASQRMIFTITKSSCDAVNFKDMYNLRAPVGTVEGFDISAFDKAVCSKFGRFFAYQYYHALSFFLSLSLPLPF